MDEVTQQNSALVEENAATAKTLEQQAQAMSEQVAFFVVDDTVDDRAAGSAGAGQNRPAMPAQMPPAAAGAKAPARQQAAVADGGPVRRMQATLATAIKADPDWTEF